MRRAGLFLAAVVAGLALAGCYTSEKMLFDEGKAVRPLVLGAQTASNNGSADPIEISLGADGWYAIAASKDSKVTRLMFTPLGGARGRDLMVFVSSLEPFGYIYGLTERRDGKILLDLPTCEPGPAREAAVAHYGVAPARNEVGAACTFLYPEDVEAALVDYAERKDVRRDYMTLTAAAEPAR